MTAGTALGGVADTVECASSLGRYSNSAVTFANRARDGVPFWPTADEL